MKLSTSWWLRPATRERKVETERNRKVLVLAFVVGALAALGHAYFSYADDVICADACEARGADYVHHDRYGCVCRKGDTTIEMIDPSGFEPEVLPSEFMVND
jgi:hypothetical protein